MSERIQDEVNRYEDTNQKSKKDWLDFCLYLIINSRCKTKSFKEIETILSPIPQEIVIRRSSLIITFHHHVTYFH